MAITIKKYDFHGGTYDGLNFGDDDDSLIRHAERMQAATVASPSPAAPVAPVSASPATSAPAPVAPVEPVRTPAAAAPAPSDGVPRPHDPQAAERVSPMPVTSEEQGRQALAFVLSNSFVNDLRTSPNGRGTVSDMASVGFTGFVQRSAIDLLRLFDSMGLGDRVPGLKALIKGQPPLNINEMFGADKPYEQWQPEVARAHCALADYMAERYVEVFEPTMLWERTLSMVHSGTTGYRQLSCEDLLTAARSPQYRAMVDNTGRYEQLCEALEEAVAKYGQQHVAHERQRVS